MTMELLQQFVENLAQTLMLHVDNLEEKICKEGMKFYEKKFKTRR